MEPTLCSPGLDLSCFHCCPPIRPPHYEHWEYRSSLKGELSRNRQDYLAGRLPAKELAGFHCPGLGFLDSSGRSVGCLYHPARNRGEDLRRVTGYMEKCARETCSQFRAFALLDSEAKESLLALCRGMDPFTFSSRLKNPLMRLLALGPGAARAAAWLGPASADDLAALPLLSLSPAQGWLAARLIQARGPELAGRADLAERIGQLASGLRRALGPVPPLERGEYIHRLTGEWEALFWKSEARRSKADPEQLARWRAALDRLLS